MLEKLKQQLIADEGKRNDIYLDHLGFKTVGIGHLITKSDFEFNMKVGTKITDERVNELFEKDIAKTIADAKIVFKDWKTFPEELMLIILNMLFNLGLSRFRGFRKMIVHIENKNYKAAAAEMEDSKWFKQVPNRAKRLQKRMLSLC